MIDNSKLVFNTITLKQHLINWVNDGLQVPKGVKSIGILK